ncbi:probable N-acetylgalactosaminyltransferase 7 [Acanthaster planci]|uniref:Polypeptide N-acetylgalactosaminyltransferase n=1 Tax=Acanthaster planci TaxID=133434 RepID=A0A8B7Z1F6_ACAPL|nr:probable N-acetylgalactosaminyltransferase 7 [Acanthaster planci]
MRYLTPRHRQRLLLVVGAAFIVSVFVLMTLDPDTTTDIPGPRELHGHGIDVPNHQPQSRASVISLPVLNKKQLGNYESRIPPPERDGPGEFGRAVKVELGEGSKYRKSIREFGFNVELSDEISLDRVVPDIRDPECKYWHYPEKLPNASVVIAFSNEGFSTLMRTVHSVINTSPPNLLAEVVMVDDMSDKEHLGKKLEDYIKRDRFQGKVRLVRNTKREGLARSRTNGAMAARGQVVVFLDAHCECSVNWLPPLLAEIAYSRTTVVCPTVDVIKAEDLSYSPQGELARGAFDWAFWYKRIPVDYSDTMKRIGMKYGSQAYDAPAMAGGLFAMDRSYFIELGTYDPGLFIWGGENFEISFKIWMCGGQLKFVPCSRVGHIYRRGVPYKYPVVDGEVSIVDRNFMRVAEVWLDEYKEHFYTFKPRLRGKSCGDISEQVAFRRKHCPKSFKWFMENVAFDSLELFPTPPPNRAWGEFHLKGTSLCLDTMGRQTTTQLLGASNCHGYGGNQEFRLGTNGQIQFDEYCVVPSWDQTKVSMVRCRESHRKVPDRDHWSFSEEAGQIRLKRSNLCMEVVDKKEVRLRDCNSDSAEQKFEVRQVR